MSDAVDGGRDRDDEDATAVPRPPAAADVEAEVGMAGPESGAD